MKIEIRSENDSQLRKCESVKAAEAKLVSFLQGIEFDVNLVGSASNKIKGPLFTWAIANGWKKSRLADPGIPTGISTAIYKINLTLDLPKSSCQHHHRIFFQAFFDNRQAIGTNLLRLSIAKNYFEKKESNRAHIIGLVVDSNSKSKFGWDKSVGTLEEYEYAASKIYDFALNSKFEFWAIRN
jgi:hypothetical protein